MDVRATAFVEAALNRAQIIVHSLKEIDEILEKASHSYSVERLQAVERNILRLGIFELMFDQSGGVILPSEARVLTRR